MGASLTDIVGISATITTIGQFISGSFTARKVWLMGTPGDLSPIPFIAGVLGSCLWFLYGVYLEDKTVVYTNLVGITANSFYVSVFLYYSPKRLEMSRKVFVMIVGVTGVIIYLNMIPEHELARQRLGLICTVVSVCSCASPLVALKHVLQTKSTETLPFPLILAIFVVCFQWWLYGVLINDFYMQVTNLLGALIGLSQLSLFLIYPSKTDETKGNYQKLQSKAVIM